MKQVEVFGCEHCWQVDQFCHLCIERGSNPRFWVTQDQMVRGAVPTGNTREIDVETLTVAPAEPSDVEKAAKAYAEAISEYKVRAEALNKLFAQREEILQQVKDANAARVAASEVVENARKALDNAAWGRE
jgi:hypothetical protein